MLINKMFISSFKINEKFNDTIKREIYGLKNSWKLDLKNVKALSSGFNPPYLFFDIIKNQLSKHLSDITNKQFRSSCWWANFYEPGHYTKPHCHKPEDISSIIFIKTGKSNPLYFDLNPSSLRIPGILRIQEYEGLVLFFDSKLIHGVDKCSEERITLAVDFKQSI